jgi:hypothetical protein
MPSLRRSPDEKPAGLAAVIDSWPWLSAAVSAGIVAMALCGPP